MFDEGATTLATPAAACGWSVPGVTWTAPPAGPAEDVVALTAAVDACLAVEPGGLPRSQAVDRAEALLALQERVGAASLSAVADVEARELWRERQAGSTRTWLRTLPCGDTGQLALSRLLQDRPVLGQAFADGQVSGRVFAAVARLLAKVPGRVDPEQLTGVLVDGLGDLMGVWAGAACLEPTESEQALFEARREQLARTVAEGLGDCWTDPAGQLEPAFTLAATVLAPAEVTAGLAVLVDALQPEAAADDAAQVAYRSRGLTLRTLVDGGWSLRAHLTDEVGQRLFDELAARDPDSPTAKARVTRREAAEHPEGISVDDVLGPAEQAQPAQGDAEGDAGDDQLGDRGQVAAAAAVADGAGGDSAVGDLAAAEADAARFGAAGAGVEPDPFGPHVEGEVVGSRDQRAHDAFAQLLADLTTSTPGTGQPAPAQLTITATLDALDRRPGAPPGRLRTWRGDIPLTAAALRRHGCTAALSAVLLDAAGRPVAASGEHRHATSRQRRALRGAWGSTCAVNGCALPGTVPHHAEPWWKTHQTVLRDLVPLCEHHHHDLHDGSKTLRLRDGRTLDEWGWQSR